MSKVSIVNQGWIDLVFEGRNKDYGAYQLRRDDSKTTGIALVAGISLMCALVAIPAMINYFKDEAIVSDSSLTLPQTTVLVDIEPLAVEQPKPAVTKPTGGTTSSQPTVAYTSLVATSDPTPTDIPDTNTVLNTNAGSTTSAGDSNGTLTGTAPTGTPPGTDTGLTLNSGGGGGGTIETFVDVAPQFPGGIQEFYDQVAHKFRTPEVDVARTMKVYVSFVVEIDGSLTAIKATRDPGLGMGAEAVRVLKSITTKWKPGMKNGKAVRTAYNLPITIKVH
ncbi:energy transducer TonB [Flavobacterium cerinum]|uniref:Energy transducer TonB n=1 Tax=Flavobacterium cerinum TaxID=2502784 RepID=A0A444HE44_9FLAO|nr:energy transducer TonB [Flavobacterium cerinum]RWX02478.1 energy transducer TonB [Flavobacterium cerinum]